MKKLILTCTLIISISGLHQLKAQQSDYQIKTEFEEAIKELRFALSSAYSVGQLDSLKKQVDSLETVYQEHEELLSAALYPSTYAESIGQIKSDASLLEHRLLIIENQNEKLDTLLGTMAAYESEIQHLNSQVQSLRNAISTSENSEKQLADLVRDYRNSLERRDNFILNVLDSLILKYDELNPQTLAELSSASGTVNESANPLQIISSIIDENLGILKSTPEGLQTEDYLRMYVVQHRFNHVWSQIGDDLAVIYGEGDSKTIKQNIEKKLADWKASASMNMWQSMDAYLEGENLQLKAFDNQQSFYTALDDYVKQAAKASEGNYFSQAHYQAFEKFHEFWNTKIKNDWSYYVQEGDVLTLSQISEIDSEIVNWYDQAKPMSLTLPILLGLSLIVIVGLIIGLVRKK